MLHSKTLAFEFREAVPSPAHQLYSCRYHAAASDAQRGLRVSGSTL